MNYRRIIVVHLDKSLQNYHKCMDLCFSKIKWTDKQFKRLSGSRVLGLQQDELMSTLWLLFDFTLYLKMLFLWIHWDKIYTCCIYLISIWVLYLPNHFPWRKKWIIYSSILAWKIPRTEEPGRLQSMGSQRVGHNLAHIHTRTHFPRQDVEYLLPEKNFLLLQEAMDSISLID